MRGRLAASVVAELRRDLGVEEIEIYVKRGRSRRLVSAAGREAQAEADEQGWAVRATTDRASFFACGTGELESGIELPAAESPPVRLPEPPDRVEPLDEQPSGAPLASEAELRRLARGVGTELEEMAPGASLVLVELEDGWSESHIGSSKGVGSGWQTRVASVTIEARAKTPNRAIARAEWLLPDLRSTSARQLAGRVSNLLVVESEGQAVAASQRDVILAPEAAAALWAGLMPLFVGPRSEEIVERLAGAGSLASAEMTLIDDGRLPGGALASPVDGEGTVTQEVVLVEEGVFRQPLLPWWRSRFGCRSGGCSRRDSWRDQPRVGPSHLYLRPTPEVSVAELVGAVATGFYLLDASGPPRFDFVADRFELPTRGFELRSGRAQTPVAGVKLTGGIGSLLQGLRGAARDLRFSRHPAGLVGSPTVLLGGLELGV